jgi:para-aminobenzoate synthetase
MTLFANEENAYWLDSSMTNSSSRFSYMGIPNEIITYSLTENSQDIFSYLKEKLESKKIKETNSNLPFDFIGGYVGYFGYELKALCGAKRKYTSPYPDSLWYYTENVIVFDHLEKNIYLVSLTKDSTSWFDEIQNKFKDIPRNGAIPTVRKKITFKLSRNHDQYLKDINTCKDYLNKGESYQICLTNNISTKINIDPLTLYRTVRKNNPAPYSVLLKHKDLSIICSSPEQFLAINKDGIVETKPIKGTTRRGENLEEDKKLIEELKTNNKEWSENAMIVDLLRNDLGKACEFGSIEVSKLMEVESYATVHQLVSTVRGKLRSNFSIIDCIKACFPGGSMTGVPKIRTMEIIDTLEQDARGIYSGAIGFLSLNNTAKLNIAIRTIVIKGESLSIGAGGAIVTQSDPEKEYDEMLLKAKILMQSITQINGVKIFLALGSNVGDKKENIKKAITLLGKHVKNISVAKIYESEPMYFEDQDIFNNTVLSGVTNLSPQELLKFVKETEKEIGRIKRFPNGPREIDIDILFYDDLVYKQTHLQIPHPKLTEREFVLQPFMDLEPALVHPVLKKTMKELYDELRRK